MNDPRPSVPCPMCEQPVPPGANFCGECGFALGSANPRGRSPKLKWFHNIWFILFLLFFVLGPFALPMVWGHPTLSRPAKLVLTLVGIAYALLMFALVTQMVLAMKSSLDAFNSTMPLY